jgi:hypothetical protein
MIKSILILILVLYINVILGYSQINNKKYVDNDGHYLKINKNHVEFFLPSPLLNINGLATPEPFPKHRGFVGEGNIIIRRHKIIINTKSELYCKGSESTYEFYPDSSKSGIFKFKLYDNLNHLYHKGAGFWYRAFDEKGKKSGSLEITEPDSNNYKEFRVINPIDSIINISANYYQNLCIKLQNLEGGTFIVKFAPGLISYFNNGEMIIKYKIRNDTIYYRYIKYGDYKLKKKLETLWLVKAKE